MKRNPKTAYICPVCRACNLAKTTHPGARHHPGICDCSCRDLEPTPSSRDAGEAK